MYNQTLQNKDFITSPPEEETYESCTFKACNLSKADVRKITFEDCQFDNCDLSNINLKNTALKGVQFSNCKLLGFQLKDCNEFLLNVHFENCQLNLASFAELKLANTIFINCDLREVDFAKADLTNVTFDNCDLSHAIFENTNLEKADLRTAYNYTIDPQKNRVGKAKFSRDGLAGLLRSFGIVVE